jgi:hypothetical protein
MSTNDLQYKSIIDLQPVAKVTGCKSMSVVMKIIEAITNDNPHLYYFDQTKVRVQFSMVFLMCFLTKMNL